MVRYLRNAEIDKEKWDNRVAQASQSLIYHQAQYLDIICGQAWGALVWNDYECIMPIPERSKAFIKYIYHPLLCQQLGIIGAYNSAMIELFWNALVKRYNYIDFAWNECNKIDLENQSNIPIQLKKNHILSLAETAEELYLKFSTNCKKNIQKCLKSDIQISDTYPLENAITFYKKNTAEKTAGLSESDYILIQKSLNFLYQSGQVVCYEALLDGETAAMMVLGNYKNRLYYLMGSSSENGRKLGAMHCLFQHIIYKYQSSNYILDFEGSEIEGIAKFFKGFGAKEVYFPVTKYNKLPKVIKWLKPN
jgi:hypothetical protein